MTYLDKINSNVGFLHTPVKSESKYPLRKTEKCRGNSRSVAQRIKLRWRGVTARIVDFPKHSDHERDQYRVGLVLIGRKALDVENRKSFSVEGTLAMISALIEGGVTKRDDIVRHVARHHSVSHRMVGYFLGKHSGGDPAQHLWFKAQDGRYQLHRMRLPAKLKVAA